MVPNRARELRHVLTQLAARVRVCVKTIRIDRSLWSRLGNAVMRLIVVIT